MIEARNRNKVTPAHSHALQSGAWIEREQTSRGCASMNTDPAESERYMIFEGVIQWTQAVALQSDRVAAAQTAQFRPGDWPGAHRLPGMNFRSECDYFSVAVGMLFQFKRRATDLGLFASVDFSEIDIVPWQDRVNVRNKRMHVTDYLKPGGEAGKGWFVETPDFKADASSIVGTLIGGRLDWAALGAAAKRLLPKLLAQPIPYPSIPGMPRPEPALPVRFLSALRAMAWDDQRVAIAWMESPNPALGGATPAEKVKTPEGMAEVVAILEPMASARLGDNQR
jgi:hypothetical protein